MFRDLRGNIIDLAARLEDCGVVLNTGEATEANWAFYLASFSHIPELDCRSISKLDSTFYNSSASPVTETIDKIILKEDGSQIFNNTFNYASKLKNITFEGVIGKSINFQYSPLTVESMKNIIEHLKNFDGINNGEDAYTQTIKFSQACWDALSADGTLAPNGKDWIDYVQNALGWNV